MTNTEENQFVDRKGYINTFNKAVNNIGQKEFNVLVYHGIAGIGKTSLRHEFPKCLEKYNHKSQCQKVIWASIDLQLPTYREKTAMLVALKNELQKKSKISFPAFEIAHAIYWKKANPEIPLRKENYLLFEGEEVFDGFLEIVNQIPYFNLIPKVARLLKGFPDYLKKRWVEIVEEKLKQLPKKEPWEIKEMLPYFWAYDLNNYLEGNSKSAVLFIDTYEGLRENYRSDGYSLDNWIINELILHSLPQRVLWVICGREALCWEETKNEWVEWSEYLTQYEVRKLPPKYHIEYLETQGIKDRKIQEAIVKGSIGVPYYLELSVKTYEKIKIYKKRQPIPEDFGGTPQEITDRFFRFLSSQERDTLNALSIPRFWDYDLFEYLVKKCNTGYSTNNYKKLCNLSFISKAGDEKRQMHQLMQKALQKTQEKEDPDSVKRIHKAICKYYRNKLKNIDIKLIIPEHETALSEAFYHAKQSLEAEDLLNWFNGASYPFEEAAFWKLIYPLYEEMLQLLKEKLGPKNSSVTETLNKLALLNCNMGNYKKAIYYYNKVSKFAKENEDRLGESDGLGGLGLVYGKFGNPKKAIKYYEQSLEILRKIDDRHNEEKWLGYLGNAYLDLGQPKEAIDYFKQALTISKGKIDRSRESVDLGNLGLVCRGLGNYKRAIEFQQQALTISKEKGDRKGEIHQLGNLGNVYRDQGNFEKAIYYYKLALEIAKEEGYRRHKGIWIGNCGTAYRYQGEFKNAIESHEQALEIARVIGDKRYEGIWLGNLGIAYYDLNELNKAINYFDMALKIAEEIGDKRYEGIWLGNLGTANYDLGELNEAFSFYKQALKIAREIDDIRNVGVWQGYLGNAYLNLGQPKEAIEYYELALEIARDIGDKRRVGKWQGYLGSAYLDLGQPKEAIEYYELALKIARDIGDKCRVGKWLGNLGNIYYDLGEKKKHLCY